MQRSVGLIALVALAAVTGCGRLAAPLGRDSDACPETIADAGVTDGIDLPVPSWVPAGFPLPDDLSLQHINDALPDGGRLLTGFVPGGDPSPVVATMRRELSARGHETLLAAEGFVPQGSDALVSLDGPGGTLVALGVAVSEAPVHQDDGACPIAPGVQVSLRFEPVDAAEARRLYAGSSLTQGDAVAEMGGDPFRSTGECLRHAGQHTFTPTGGDQVALQFERTEARTTGTASAGSESTNAIYVLAEVTPVQTPPRFSTSAEGFSVQGRFLDAVGNRGLVDGSVTVRCR